jgi:hypothetical protein
MTVQNIEALRAQADAANNALREAEAANATMTEEQKRAERNRLTAMRVQRERDALVARMSKLHANVIAALSKRAEVDGEDCFLLKRGFTISAHIEGTALQFSLLSADGETNVATIVRLTANDTPSKKRVSGWYIRKNEYYSELKTGGYNFDRIADDVYCAARQKIRSMDGLSARTANESFLREMKERAPTYSDHIFRATETAGIVEVNMQHTPLTYEQAEKLRDVMLELGITRAK